MPITLHSASSGESEAQLVRILTAVAAVLLLVCCANLAGLLTAQGAARTHEFAVRLSLGAGRARVIRQFLTESLLLAVIGGLSGVILSRGFIWVIASLFYAVDDEGHPRYFDFSLTPEIIVTVVAASVAAGILFSVVPAFSVAGGVASRVDRRGFTAKWSSGRWLLAAQAAVAVALVAVAALLTTSARSVVVGTSFESSHVALMRVRPRLMKYTPDRAQQFQRDVVQRLCDVPGVESVTMVGIGAILGGGTTDVGLPGWAADQHVRAGYNEIGPRYFETLRMRLVTGREFDDHDGRNTPRVAIVNETLVREVNRVDGNVPIAETITLPIQMAGWVRPVRISATFIGYAAGLAVLLTAIGLYGSLAFAVSRRTKEIGIRMALGAARASVLGLIVREGMTVIAIGAIAGLALAAVGTRLVTHLLYRSASEDSLFYAAAAGLVSAVGLIASLMPARRAAAVEPLVALRHE